MKRNLLILIVFIYIAAFAAAKAANQSDILINEIAWMGSANSTTDEWMELLNNTDNAIDLSGWALKSADGKIKINLSGQVPAKGFYLLERTDDNTVPDISADKIYTGALNNNGQDLRLYDSLSNLIDRANFASGWPFGNNATKQTMERTNSLDWQTSKDAGGTPRAQNSLVTMQTNSTTTEINAPQNTDALSLETKKASNLPANTETPTPAITYPDSIVINEILPSPEGPDETNEWVELYNSGALDVDLENWKIEDTRGTTTTYIFLKDTKIPSNGYLVLKRPETKIALNNDGDGLNLILPNKKIIDSVSFTKSPKNQSYSKVQNSWQWSATLTPGSLNIVEQMLPKSNKIDNNMAVASIKEAVNIGDELNPVRSPASNWASPWFLFLTAIAITIISAVIILILKTKVLKK